MASNEIIRGLYEKTAVNKVEQMEVQLCSVKNAEHN